MPAPGRHQDRAKRVSVHPDFDLSGELLAPCAQGAQLLYQGGYDQPGDDGARHNHMLAERLVDVFGMPLGHAGSRFLQAHDQALATLGSEGGGCRVSLRQVEHGRMLEARSQDALERGMDLREHGHAGDCSPE